MAGYLNSNIKNIDVSKKQVQKNLLFLWYTSFRHTDAHRQCRPAFFRQPFAGSRTLFPGFVSGLSITNKKTPHKEELVYW
jgi:hypothetical protein